MAVFASVYYEKRGLLRGPSKEPRQIRVDHPGEEQGSAKKHSPDRTWFALDMRHESGSINRWTLSSHDTHVGNGDQNGPGPLGNRAIEGWFQLCSKPLNRKTHRSHRSMWHLWQRIFEEQEEEDVGLHNLAIWRIQILKQRGNLWIGPSRLTMYQTPTRLGWDCRKIVSIEGPSNIHERWHGSPFANEELHGSSFCGWTNPREGWFYSWYQLPDTRYKGQTPQQRRLANCPITRRIVFENGKWKEGKTMIPGLFLPYRLAPLGSFFSTGPLRSPPPRQPSNLLHLLQTCTLLYMESLM